MDNIHTDQFWLLIDNAVKAANGNKRLKETYLTTELEKRSLDDIKNFELAFRQCVIDADDYKVMAAQKIITNYVSDDSYLYFRCWLIGQGQQVFTETLKNPDYLANVIDVEDPCSWEELMYVATEAYSKKTGKEENEDEDFPRNFACKMGLDYDFGAPPTKGTDWTYKELPALLPNLWSKFN